MSLYMRHRHKVRQPVSLSAAGDDHQIHDYVPVLATDDSAGVKQQKFSPGKPHMSSVVVSRKRRPRGNQMSSMKAMGLAGQIGYIIAIPAVLFGVGGAYLDKYMGTTPAFMMGGLLLAFVSSAMAVKKMIDQMNWEEQQHEKSILEAEKQEQKM